MPRRKKTPPEELLLKFTGKMTVVVGLEGYGPMAVEVDDLDAVYNVLRRLLIGTDAGLNVTVQTRADTRRLTKVLEHAGKIVP